jgi:hypothetical protein
MLTGHDDVRELDRIEWQGHVFETDGPPVPTFTPFGLGAHHTEVGLRVASG